MNGKLAVARMWGMGAIWVAEDEPQEAIGAEATVVHDITSLPGRPAGGVRRLGAGRER